MRYKPAIGQRIKFKYLSETHTGTIHGVFDRAISVTNHTVIYTDAYGNLINVDHFVEAGMLIGEVR